MSPGGLDRRRIPEVASDERLGREVFSGSDIRRRAGFGEVNYRAFYDKRSPGALSVDRLDLAPLDLVAGVGRRNAERRGPGRRFHGWGVIEAHIAAQSGRSVAATPTAENPFHADIRIPLVGATPEERDICLRGHAQELASASVFCRVHRPSIPSES